MAFILFDLIPKLVHVCPIENATGMQVSEFDVYRSSPRRMPIGRIGIFHLTQNVKSA